MNARTTLLNELDKQRRKGAAQHHVEGYRQTEGARALLAAARDRQRAALKWREEVLELDGELSERKESWYVSVGSQFKLKHFRVYAVDGVDRAVVETARGVVNYLDGEDTMADYMSTAYMRARKA